MGSERDRTEASLLQGQKDSRELQCVCEQGTPEGGSDLRQLTNAMRREAYAHAYVIGIGRRQLLRFPSRRTNVQTWVNGKGKGRVARDTVVCVARGWG